MFMVCRLWSAPNTNILQHFQIDALKAWNAVNIINAGMGLPGWMKNDTRGAETRLPLDLEHVRTRPLRISLLVKPQCLSSFRKSANKSSHGPHLHKLHKLHKLPPLPQDIQSGPSGLPPSCSRDVAMSQNQTVSWVP